MGLSISQALQMHSDGAGRWIWTTETWRDPL